MNIGRNLHSIDLTLRLAGQLKANESVKGHLKHLKGISPKMYSLALPPTTQSKNLADAGKKVTKTN